MGCSSLTSISIPNSVTSIGNETFRHCGSLKSITIPDSVTSIGDCAFDGCETLASISIPNSVTSIGNETFTYCGSLKSITIPDSVTSIGEETFKYCNELESISISDRVTSIGKETFYCCKKLTSVNIPNGVTSIGDRAFYTCESLTSISIPDSVTSIGDKSFYNCTSLESIFLPEDLIVTKASIPDTATQVRYSIENGEVTIAGITLGTGKTSVAIPATICGYPVVAVKSGYWEFVGAHTCKGGTATCTAKALCSICGEEYNNPDNHTGTKVWEQNETQHKQYWDCCNAVVVDYENHTWNNGVCSVCDYICKHEDADKDHECDFCGESLPQQSSGTSDDSDNDSKADAEGSAKTGDDTNLALWLALMLLAGAGITGTTIYTRRKRTNE